MLAKEEKSSEVALGLSIDPSTKPSLLFAYSAICLDLA